MRIEENKFLRNYLMYYGKWEKKMIFVILLIFPSSGNKWKKKFNYNEKKIFGAEPGWATAHRLD